MVVPPVYGGTCRYNGLDESVSNDNRAELKITWAPSRGKIIKVERKKNKRLNDLARYAIRNIRSGGECKNDSRNIRRESRND